MKFETDIYSPAFGSKDAHTTTELADKLELARILDRHRFIEVKKPTIDVSKRMDLEPFAKSSCKPIGVMPAP